MKNHAISRPVYGRVFRPVFLFCLGMACLASISSGCLIQPASLPPTPGNTTGPLRLVVADPLLADVVCQAFKSDDSIACGDGQRWTAAELDRGPSALLRGRLIDSSRDLWRNTGISVASFTTALIVSTSGTMEYSLTLPNAPARHDETATRHASWRSRGRVGMWSVIPFYTGLAGTWIGTALNEYRLPENLRASCLAGSYPNEREPDFDPCQEYAAFIQDSYAPVHAPLRDALRRIPANREIEFARRDGEVQENAGIR